MSKSLVLVILGPTASGKSALAVRLAKKFGGEIISADSRQVYKGLDIGSGKLEAREMQGVPHHLLDIASPKRKFSVSRFQKLADAKIRAIQARGHLPILCGGTGFYLEAVVDGLVLPPVPPDPKLRKELAKLTTAELFKKLQTLNPARAAKIDQHNPHRLIRAIEIALGGAGKTPEGSPWGILKGCPPEFQFLQIGLNPPPKILRQKIHRRLIVRLNHGLIEEVKKLHRNGLSWKRLDELGLEYRYVARFLQNKLTRPELEKELETAIWHYAKRQLTWFRRDQRIKWVKNYSEATVLLARQTCQAASGGKMERKNRKSAARRSHQPRRP